MEIGDWGLEINLQSLISNLLLLVIPVLYLLTLAHSPVLGDPTEFTFIAHILGIAHPPGYAFLTLAGKLFQTLIPTGSIAWRMHLLSAVAATLAALFVYGTVGTVAAKRPAVPKRPGLGTIAALAAALTVATAANFWQHAIHANPHVITATFLAANLYLLTKWWAAVDQPADQPTNVRPLTVSWLLLFSLSAGLGVTHHPLTLFAWPAYALFIVLVRPSLLRQGRTLLKMAGFFLLGLTPWLYFPLRSTTTPFGPTTMNSLSGFLDYVLARGLSNTLPFYTLADQPNRALVFWTLLRLQYALPIIFLALFGVIWLFWGDKVTRRQGDKACPEAAERVTHRVTPSPRHLVILYTLAFLLPYVFVISLKVQDIMAYLLGPFLVVGLLAGIGLYSLLALLRRQAALSARGLFLLATPLFLLGPVLQILRNAPHVSLRHYDEGRATIEAVFDRFHGRNEGAVLLNDWEHMTPLWYARYVEGRWPDPADVRPRWIAAGTANPWLDNVIEFLPGGPVYLSNYRREVVDFGFRLRPAGPFYRVVEAGETSLPLAMTPAAVAGGDVEVAGYWLPQTAVSAGDYVPLALALRAPKGTADYYVPVLRLGPLTYEFTTDSHLLTPWWQPGEVIVERFDFALPHDLPGGAYPLTLDLKNLSTDEIVELDLGLAQLDVTGRAFPVTTDHLLANFRQRVGLVSASARSNGSRAAAPWPAEDPLVARPGDTIHLTLNWQSLAPAEESYTVFVHLIDGANVPHVTLDYTPLGGATPTHLWIPKWLPGQQMLDPYRLRIPVDLPPGTYYVEVGLYEMVSRRRLHISDKQGNLNGDRYILGPIVVE